MRSERRPDTRLRPGQVAAIAAAHAGGANARALAAAYGVTSGTIHAVVRRIREGRLGLGQPASAGSLGLPGYLVATARGRLLQLTRPELEEEYGRVRGRSGPTVLSTQVLVDIIAWNEINPRRYGTGDVFHRVSAP